MSKRRKNRGRPPASPGAQAAAARLDVAAALAALCLAAVLAGSALVYDTASDASFDAPKRLVTLFGTAAAALLAFGLSRWISPFSGSGRVGVRDPRVPVFLAAAALALAAVAAVASPRRTLSLDTLRALLVTALLLPLGASRVLEKSRGLLVAAFLGSAAVNAAVSILQARGIYQPFPLVTRGDREATGAFAGNVGYLALALALAAVVALGIALTHRTRGVRAAAGAAALLFAAALLVNRNLTSLSALLVGAAVLLFALYGRRAAVPLAGALVVLAAGVALYRPMRERAAGVAVSVRTGDWDQLVSYRTAPWAAAISMALERPLLGFGPGTFQAEFVAHRLQAEVRLRRRLANPLVTSTYSEAHCDYLQPFSEAGAAAGVAAIGAAALLILGIAGRARSSEVSERMEAIVILALLAAGATAALTWFPMQRPVTAAPLLLAAGRGWRLWRDASPGEEHA